MKSDDQNLKKPKHRFDLSNVKGILPFLAIIVNLCFWSVPLMILAVLNIIIPFTSVRKGLYWLMTRIYYLAAWFDGIVLFKILGIHLHVTGIEEDYPDKFYLIIANHQTWSDIFIVQHLFNFKGPLVKFLVKRELMFLPIVGWICWAYDFPFLQRRSFKSTQNQNRRNDTHLLTISIDKFKRSSASIMNFVEGTRFSLAKSNRHSSPYKHLLQPKSKGLYTIFQMLGDQLDAIIDITIVYDSPNPDFWDFLAGRCRQIKIKANTIKPHEVFSSDLNSKISPDFELIKNWIKTIWKNKDGEIEHMKKQFQ